MPPPFAATPPPPSPARTPWQGLFTPLSLAGLLAWVAVVSEPWSALWQHPAARTPLAALGVGAHLAVLGLFVARELVRHEAARQGLTLAQALAALGACAVFADGMQPILLVPVASQAALVFSRPLLGAYLLATNAALLGLTRWHHPGIGPGELLLVLLTYGSFQAFAVLLARFARQAERARDAAQRLNAELLATRELLAAGTRADERLALSRELHDTAGHTLTALKVQLALLERRARAGESPAPEALAGLGRLADDLLADIRAVVGTLRRHDGVPLGTALAALAQAFPEPRVRVEVAPDALAPGLPQATALLRAAQEGLTNAARHARARTVRVSLDARPEGLELRVADDGAGLRENPPGHGLTGMRERLGALGGTLAFADTPGGGLTLVVRLPHPVPERTP